MSNKLISLNLIIIFILIGISVSACSKSSVKAESKQSNDIKSLENDVPEIIESVAPVPTHDPEKVNRENFEKIKNGMTEDEIFGIFNGFGEDLTTVEDYEEEKKQISQLDAPDGKGKILIIFQDGKVIEKKAIDLK